MHRLLIEINCSIEQEIQGFNIESLSKFYQFINYIRDIDFCITQIIFNILTNYCQDYPLKGEIIKTFLNKDKRFFYFLLYQVISQEKIDNNESEEKKLLNNTIKYKDTVVIGDQGFHKLIKDMNLPCKNIYYSL